LNGLFGLPEVESPRDWVASMTLGAALFCRRPAVDPKIDDKREYVARVPQPADQWFSSMVR
jgi:hypothetical protein